METNLQVKGEEKKPKDNADIKENKDQKQDKSEAVTLDPSGLILKKGDYNVHVSFEKLF